MSHAYERDLPPAPDLQERIAIALRDAIHAGAPMTLTSGFTDPGQAEDPGHWRPLGEFPRRFVDRSALGACVKFCIFQGRAYVGVLGSQFAEWERVAFAHTRQPLAIVLNGCEAIDVTYAFDGREDWTYFPVDLPDTFAEADIHGVEIERDGKLLFSQFVSEQADMKNYRPTLWQINARGVLFGTVDGAVSDVPVEIHIGDKIEWSVSGPPAVPGRPRVFECDIAPFCASGALIKITARNPATGVEALHSPVGAFVSEGDHFLLANVEIADDVCRATLVSRKDGKKRPLMLARRNGENLDKICPVNLEDVSHARFEDGKNSFAINMDVLRSNDILILGEDGAVVGKFPPLQQILEFIGLRGQQSAVIATDFAPAPEPTTERAWVVWAQEAVAESDWPAAIARWERCIAIYGAKPDWLSSRAHALMKAGRLEEAEQEYNSLTENFPELPNGVVGLAWLAHEKADWESAVARWTLCLEKYSGDRSIYWKAGKADALRNLGRYEEALQLLEELTQQHPQERKFAKSLVRTKIDQAHKTRRLPERHDELRSAVDLHFNSGGEAADRIENIQLLARLGDHGAAQERLQAAIARVTTIDEMEKLFTATGELVELGSRGSTWEKLLLAVRAARPKSRDRLLDLELRLLLALARFQEFAQRFDAAESELSANTNFHLFQRIRARLGKPRNAVFAERKIFGIGLSRTGTRSLTQALNAFGIDAAHWTNPLTHQLISTTDIFLFGACADISVTQDFEKLYYQYPNALFVWTQRPLEDWVKSVARHYEFWHRTSDISGLQQEFGRDVIPFGLSRAAIEFGLYLNAGSFEEAYRQFEQRVRSFFAGKPPGKLLELNFFEGQGWKELGAFLDLPLPEQPFPHVNKGV